jgi:hypothetical protein
MKKMKKMKPLIHDKLQIRYQHYEHQHYCFNCSHTKGLHPKSSCTTTVKTRKEWYILGNVKLAEAIVPEPCKCKKFISNA